MFLMTLLVVFFKDDNLGQDLKGQKKAFSENTPKQKQGNGKNSAPRQFKEKKDQVFPEQPIVRNRINSFLSYHHYVEVPPKKTFLRGGVKILIDSTNTLPLNQNPRLTVQFQHLQKLLSLIWLIPTLFVGFGSLRKGSTQLQIKKLSCNP